MPSLITLALLAVAFVVIPTSDGKTDNVKICVGTNKSLKTNRVLKYCDLLSQTKKTRATCVFGNDRLDCLRLVSDRKADFTVLEAEDLLFAKDWEGTSVLVVSEIRALKKEPYEYKAVVVIRNGRGVPSDLRGAKLCHPGWRTLTESSALFSQYLEERVRPQSCSTNVTLNEDRLRTSATFFGPSCKAGIWSEDPNEDERLKNTYSMLCQLCENPSKCSYPDKYGGSGGAATCLKDGLGDVLWASYKDVHLYFKLQTDADGETASQFSFLCEDGKTQPLNTTEPCYWLARPWQVVVANIKAATDVQKTIELLRDDHTNEWEENLINIIESYMEYIVNLAAGKTAEDYLETIPGYMGASEMSRTNCKPSREVTWCTYDSMAFRKCSWIGRAASASGIYPVITCIQKPFLKNCLQAVQSKKADVVVVPPDYQPAAMLRHNMSAVFYENFKGSTSTHTLAAIVKRDSRIKKLSDLRSHHACFTVHNGFTWRSVVVRLREEKLISESCGSSGLLNDFFGSVCVTGDAFDDSEVQRCCPGATDDTDPDTSAFRCLSAGGCDVAFVPSSTLMRNTDGNNTALWAENLHFDDFRNICSSNNKGECSLSWAYPSAVMVANDLVEWKYWEVHRVFSQLSQRFVRKEKDNIMLSMFGPFQDEANVIFQDSSVGLITADRVQDSPYFLQEIVNKTKYCSSSSIVTSTILSSFLSCILLFLVT